MLKSTIEKAGVKMNSLTNGVFTKSRFALSIYSWVMSGWRDFGEFKMYVPRARAAAVPPSNEETVIHRYSDFRFWDIGANIGYYSLYAADKAESVVAIEPEPYNFNILEKNINKNDFNNITPLKVALSDVNGEAELYRHQSKGAGHHSLVNGNQLSGDTYTVETRTLDQLSTEYPIPDVIKIDVEGAEQKVLEGGQELLDGADIDLLIEVHSSDTGEREDKLERLGGDVATLHRLLSELGYDIYGFSNAAMIDFKVKTEDAIPVHWFATKLPHGDFK